MNLLETHGHFDVNHVRVGDKVVAYETIIGTIGTGNGQYYAHDHLSYSRGLSPQEVKAYIGHWSKEKVEQYYINPHTIGIDFDRMYADPVNIGVSGYDWLQNIGYGFHPGVDINGLGGGNTDNGMEVKAGITGKVVLADATWGKNGGWGNILIIEEETSSPEPVQETKESLPIQAPAIQPKKPSAVLQEAIELNSSSWEKLQQVNKLTTEVQQQLSQANDKLRNI